VIEPGSAVDAAALVAAAWPQEKLRPKSAARRLQVALSTLRQMGLRDVVESSGGGYRLSVSHSLELRHWLENLVQP